MQSVLVDMDRGLGVSKTISLSISQYQARAYNFFLKPIGDFLVTPVYREKGMLHKVKEFSISIASIFLVVIIAIVLLLALTLDRGRSYDKVTKILNGKS